MDASYLSASIAHPASSTSYLPYAAYPSYDFTGTLPLWEIAEYEPEGVESHPLHPASQAEYTNAYNFWEQMLVSDSGGPIPGADTHATGSSTMLGGVDEGAVLLHPVPRPGGVDIEHNELWPMIAEAQTGWCWGDGPSQIATGEVSTGTTCDAPCQETANDDVGNEMGDNGGEDKEDIGLGVEDNTTSSEAKREDLDASKKVWAVDGKTEQGSEWPATHGATVIAQSPKATVETMKEVAREPSGYRIVSVQRQTGDPRKHERIYQHEDGGGIVNMIVQARVCDIEWNNGHQVLYIGGGSAGCARMHAVLEAIIDVDSKFYLGVASMQPWVMRTEDDDFLLLVTVPGHVEINMHSEESGRPRGFITQRRIERGMYVDCTFTLQTKARIEKTLGRPRRTWNVTWVLEATKVLTYAATPQATNADPRLAMIVEEQIGGQHFYELTNGGE